MPDWYETDGFIMTVDKTIAHEKPHAVGAQVEPIVRFNLRGKL